MEQTPLNNNPDILQSKAINYLRFPLALLVVSIHFNVVLIECPKTFGESLYNIIACSGSIVIARVAVPMFFLFSGYLFFYKIKDFTRNEYASKVKKRFKTLVLPYIYWNLIAFALLALKPLLNSYFNGAPIEEFYAYLKSFSYHIFWDSHAWGTTTRFLGFTFYAEDSGPINAPLWFLRNLIILTVVSPIIYLFIKKIGKIFIAILTIIYLTGVFNNLSPYSFYGVFYFSLGAYMSINNLRISDCFGKHKTIIWVLFSVLIPLCVYLFLTNQHKIYSLVFPTSILIGVVSIYNVMYYMIDTRRYDNQLPILARSSFFIYCLHQLSICYQCGVVLPNKITHWLFGSYQSLADIVAYLIGPFVVAAVILAIYIFMDKFTPKLLYALTGSR